MIEITILNENNAKWIATNCIIRWDNFLQTDYDRFQKKRNKNKEYSTKKTDIFKE